MIPILLFAAAGTLAGGGVGGSYYLWQKASRATAEDLSQDDLDHVEGLVRKATGLADAVREAEAACVNVDAVVRGYTAVRDRHIALVEVMRRFTAGDVSAPVDDPNIGSSSFGVASSADIRAWAKSQGMDVADTGRLSNDVIAAYRLSRGDG